MDPSIIQYIDFNDYLSKHSAKNENIKNSSLTATHTRIPHPDKSLHIYGGSYVIPQEELTTFYALYYNHVFTKKKLEYLTEKQLTLGNGPILLDFDFRFKYDVEARQHTKEHITDLLAQVYLEELKSFFLFNSDTQFQIYVMEKSDVIRLEDKGVTKDGIHIIIGIQMDHIMQQMLRQRVLPKVAELWGNESDGGLPLTNLYDSVLDEGISKGTTNWQMYGSRKPGNLAYELTQLFNITLDSTDGEFMIDEQNIDSFDISTNYNKLSAQYDAHPKYKINPNITAEYDKMLELKTPKFKKNTSKTKISLLIEEDDTPTFVDIKDINNSVTLDKAIQYMFSTFSAEEYNLKEVHDYTQILPAQYYESGSHEKCRLVAFALKNTDERLFLSWIKLRSKASDFDYSEILELYSKWTKYFNKNDKSQTLTYKSIIFWARQDAPLEYMKIKEQTLDHFIDATILEPTEFDFAMILFHMFKDKYTCTSITAKTWYVFNNHCWEQDKGDRLRYSISKEMFNLYKLKRDSVTRDATQYDSNDPKREAFNSKINKITAILGKLKKTSDKNNIFREAHEIFYDKHFIDKMDTNKYLMCFSNGVVDFKNKIFRDGHPQDYITKSTRIPYTAYNSLTSTMDTNPIIQNIVTFMEQLFPDESLNKYMWNHLSSVLIGENMNQTFNIYLGSGSNGKSILMDLMSQTLGEYKGTVPITLVTEKRGCIGGTSSEVMQLKGIRYAVMQEPSKNAKINEGPMKELTGGDPLQARGLYKESETFLPQFSLAVCTNTLFDITSNDDGTWRRIRLCNFVSKFVDEIVEDPDELEPVKQFIKDKSLKEKLPIWAPIFASMLVERAFLNQGKVEDCPIVMAASSKYRNSQDYIAAFVTDRIIKEGGKNVKQKELSEEFKIWYASNVMRPIPANTINELNEFISKKFGSHKNKIWNGIKIRYDVPENDIVALASV